MISILDDTQAGNEKLRRNQAPLVGRRFHMILVVATAPVINQKRMVVARCDCGKEFLVRANSLLSGNTKSCGCYRPAYSHGHARKGLQSRTYRIWCDMRSRCAGKISPHNYAARGIACCDRWLSFENFLADMGEAPDGYSLERNNNDGNYEPNNCRWATAFEQARNRRNNVFLEHEGKRLCLADWATHLGTNVNNIRNRLDRGLDLSKIVMEYSK